MDKKNILIVEDELIVATAIQSILKKYGWQNVFHASTGERALEIAAEQKIDLVLMDIQLPGAIDGIEAARRIRNEYDIPLIYLTANADIATIRKARETRPFGYLNKPVSERDLYSNIDSALHRHALESAVKESEEKYRIIVENFNGIAYQAFFGSNELPFIGGKVTEITGYPAEDFLSGRINWLDLVLREDIEKVVNERRKMSELGRYAADIEYRIKTRNGAVRWVTDLAQAVRDRQGHPLYIQGAIYDFTEKKEAQAALESSEELYRSLFRNNQAVMMLIDPEDGAIVDANPAASRYYGWSVAELKKKKISEINILSDEEIRHEMSNAKTERRNFFQFRHRRADGSIRDVEVHSGPIEFKGRKLLHSVVHDNSERQTAKLALMESEERYRRITETVTDYIFTVRIENEKPVETTHGSACIAVTGYTSEEFAADPYLWIEMVHEGDRGLVQTQAETILAGKDPGSIVHRLRRKDGQIRWVENTPVIHRDRDGTLISYDGVIRDITDRQIAEDALRKSEEHCRLVSELTSDFAYAFKVGANGTLHLDWMTDAFQRITGYAPEEILSQDRGWIPIIHPEDAPGVINGYSRVLTGQNDEAEMRIVTKSGAIRWLRVFSEPILSPLTGRTERIYGAVQDITDKKDTEEALRTSEERYRRLIEEINDIVYAMDEKGVFTFISPVCRSITGFEPEDLIGRPFADFLYPEDAVRITENYGHIEHAAARPNEFRIRTKTGSYIWVRSSSRPLFENGSFIGVRGVLSDISAHIRAEDKFVKAFTHNPSPMAISRLETSEFIEVNEVFSAVLGYSRAELVGKRVRELGIFADPDDLERVDLLMKRDGCVRNYSLEVRTKNGIAIHGLYSADYIDIGGERFHLSVLQDITEHIRIEEELERERTILRTLIDLIPDPIYAKDKETRKTLANRADLDNLGCENEEEALERTDYDFYPREIAEQFQADDQRVLRSGNAVLNHEEALISSTGARKWLLTSKVPLKDRNGDVVGLVGIGRDITERKLSVQALKESEERYRSLVDLLPEGIVIHRDGKILFANRACSALLGYEKPEELYEKPITEFIHPDDRAPILKGARNGFADNDALPFEEERFFRKDGSILYGEVAATPLAFQGQDGMLVVVRDVTEKRKFEESLRNAQRLEALGVLAGGIAHDFNNLLSGIFGFLDLAKLEAPPGTPIEEYIAKALSVFGRARHLTQQLLTFSKGGKPIRKPSNLKPILVDTVNFTLSGSNITPVFRLPNDLFTCELDENQFGQVIDNIILNARQAMPTGGRITIEAENCPNSSPLPGILNAGDWVCIRISDEGHGISPEHLSRIFDPFFTTKNQGSGLGLTTAYSIVKRHDGHITVESRLGKGTEVTIHLPATAAPVRHNPATGNEPYHGSGRILLVDDENFILEVTSRMIEMTGHKIDTAGNLENSVRKFRQALESGNPYRAVILDLTMAGGPGGREILAELKKIDPGVMAVASSGYSEDPIMAQPAQYGFADRLVKPYSKDELAKVLRRLFG